MKVKDKTPRLRLSDLDLGHTDNRRVFDFLLADTWMDYCKTDLQLDVIDCIRMGLPRQAMDAVLNKTFVSRNQLSHILHISTRQMNRYEQDDKLSPEQSNFLFEFARVYTRAVDIFGDDKTAEHWLSRSNTALGDQIPVALLDTAEGVRLVNDLLSQIEYGFYS